MPDHMTSKAHIDNPVPGDYWQEMLHGVCVVLDVEEYHLTICKAKKEVGRDHWTWDLKTTEKIHKDDFRKWLEYGPHMKDKYWASVMPERHKWAVKEWYDITLDEIKDFLYPPSTNTTDTDADFEGCPI